MWLLAILLGVAIAILLIQRQRSSFDQEIQILVRQAARWSVAAENDKNPMIAVLHANYGAGYLWALQDIATPAQIEQSTGIDYKQFRASIIRVQETATRRAIRACPQFSPVPSHLRPLARIAGEF